MSNNSARFAIPESRVKQIAALFILNYLVWQNKERPRIKYRLFKRDNTLSIENGPLCIQENNSPGEKRERENLVYQDLNYRSPDVTPRGNMGHNRNR